MDLATTITIRSASGEEVLDLEEFEARVERGELEPSTEVCFPPVTGAAWARAGEIEAFYGLFETKTLYFSRAFTLGRIPVFTLALALANLAIFLLETRAGPVDTSTMVAFGAKAGPLIHDLGQLWRLLTANFVHRDWVHIGFNLFVLFHFGAALENAFRPLDYLCILVAAALGTTVLSYGMTDAVSAGASGMAYGMLGGAVVFGLQYRRILPDRYRAVLGGAVVPTVLVFLYIGFTSSGVDNWGHVGGLVAGAATTALFRPRLLGDRPGPRRVLATRVAPLLAVFLGLGFGGTLLADRLPALVPIVDERFGIELPVPGSWRQGEDRLGPVAFHNGLAGPVHASIAASARISDEPPDLEDAARRFVADELFAEAKAGRIGKVSLEPLRYAHVGGMLGVQVQASFDNDDTRTRLAAHFFSRGDLVYQLVLARPESLPEYDRVFERILTGVKAMEPAFVGEARERAERFPSDWQAWMSLAEAEARAGAWAEARTALERATRLEPDRVEPVAHLAKLAFREGLPREGCRLAAKARSMAPRDELALEASRICAESRGDPVTSIP